MHLTKTKIIILSVFILLSASAGYAYSKVHHYYQVFLSHSGLSTTNIKKTLQQADEISKQLIATSPAQINFLILGLDHREDTLEQTSLTDAIMIGSYHKSSNTLNLVPLPRDLYLDAQKTKINALYYYEKTTARPGFTLATLSQVTGQNLEHFLILDYSLLPELIDLVGGVTIDNPVAFTDDQFPNPQYLVDKTAPIFQTISFPAGPQTLTGEKALQFVRSRHSDDQVAGTDLARSQRQMIVIQGLIAQISTKRLLLSPDKLGQLYKFWHDKIITNLTDATLLGLAIYASPASLPKIQTHAIPTSLDSQEPLLINPPLSRKYQNQWIFLPTDPSFSKLHHFFETHLTN